MNGNFILVETISPFASIDLLPLGRAHVLGRSTKCDIVVNHPTVSRRHAEISMVDSTLLVLDLGSFNGTFIDQERVLHGDPGVCISGVRELEPRADIARREDAPVAGLQTIVDENAVSRTEIHLR